MAWELEYDETQLPPDRPCAKCASIGENTVCVRQLRDKTQPSCSSGCNSQVETPSELVGTPELHDFLSQPTRLASWKARYSVNDLERGATNSCYLCTMMLHKSRSALNPGSGISVSLGRVSWPDDFGLELNLGSRDSDDSFLTVLGGMSMAARAPRSDLLLSTST